jgi:hypothetical protein
MLLRNILIYFKINWRNRSKRRNNSYKPIPSFLELGEGTEDA